MRTALVVSIALTAAFAFAADPARQPRPAFTRLIAHWDGYATDDYLKFVEEARPEVCQLGFYGGHFYSLAHTPQYKGYPAHFPVQGLKECGKWFEDRNAAVHKLGPKVVGHFNVTFLVGEPAADGKEPRGFFKFYQDLWDEKELGPKPVADPMALLARNPDGTPMASKQYSIGQMREYTACLNNPHWRAVLKAWAKRGIDRGVDGYMINYFYRHNCLCEHCQKGFRDYLGTRFTPEQLRKQFEIADVKTHQFTEIVGWHDPKTSTPLRREMLRWSQLSTKAAFDDVFVKYARSLKPDLLLGQWNHLGDFNQVSGDERSMLPPEVWGKDEDYLWYSTGGAACFTDLEAGVLGEGTLQARYIRGAFDNKPFTLGKYESARIRVAIAELAANGGAPMGFYTRFSDPEARKEIVRYYNFLEKYDAVYKNSRPHAEVLLLFPRSKVHDGDVAAVERFKSMGTRMLDAHLLFDVLPDDLATPAKRAAYRGVFDPAAGAGEVSMQSRFKGPKTVRVSASVPAAGGELDLHFVNYNREEPAKKRSPGTGIKDEKPIAAEGVAADVVLPRGATVAGVRVVTPEEPDGVEVKFEVNDGRVRFAVPKFLVYAVARVMFAQPAGAAAFPDYQPVVGWPKLPAGVTLGPVSAVATDRDDRVFVFHRGPKPALVFDRDGTFLRGWGDEHLKTPHGLRIDAGGNVWVTDIGTHQVLKFDPDGKLLLALGKKGEPGDAPDRFDRPTDVAVTPAGDFYVTDGYGNSRVLKFDRAGKLLRQWGKEGTGPGEFDLPHAIVLDAAGRVYVGDRENNRVQVFDPDGKFLAEWKESGAPYGLFRSGDRTFVADGRANWIRVLDADGKPLGRWGGKGTGPGQFRMPHMLCVDGRGAVYVTEVTGKRVQKFVPRGE
jgi:hypothetical protein